MKLRKLKKLVAGILSAAMIMPSAAYAAPKAADEVEMPKALYEFTMNEVKDGTGANAGKKVIVNNVDSKEYPIYGTYNVDQNGIYDQCINFDGVTAYADLGRPDVHKAYTLMAWTNINDGSNSLNKFFGRDRTTVGHDAFYFAVRNNGAIEVFANPPQGQTGTGSVSAPKGSYQFNNWNHLALTCDGTSSKLYYNGKQIAERQGQSFDLDSNPLPLLLGCGYNAAGDGIFNGHAFKGRMDDVRIYDVALTAEQIEKSTEGIKENLPPEISYTTPTEGMMISKEGVLRVTFGMEVSLGEAKAQIIDREGNPLETELRVEDFDKAVAGAETLVIQPSEALKSGRSYTYKIPADAVVNGNGIGNHPAEYNFSVQQDLAGDSEESDLEYWAEEKLDIPSVIEEKDGMVTMSNGLVERVFDLNQNFLTIEYKNLYTGISTLDKGNLQADATITLNDQYVENSSEGDVFFNIGGVDKDVPTFQFENYTVEDSTKAPFHWEWDENISPASMKDTPWPAKGKALVVNYKAPEGTDAKFAGVKVQVRYEIYDGMPSISKIINVTNTGENDVVVHHMTTEVLPVPKSLESALYFDMDMNMGYNNHDRNLGRYDYKQWEDVDGANGRTICQYLALSGNNGSVRKNFGPNYRLKQDEEFTSYKLYELFHSNSYYEWQCMEIKKLYRVLFPQTVDAPLIYHLISSNSAKVKEGIDQAAAAGFDMVLLSFGSGANVENISEGNIAKYKELCDYAHAKNIMLGSYVMQIARGDNTESVGPQLRCMNGVDAHKSLENTLTFIDRTGLDCLEIDGPYPGIICKNTGHSGHEGEEDSITKQWEYAIRYFYKELRERNVYINAPDWQYGAGANMAVMGYQESGFNVTPKEQLVYGRQMAYYGTFEKTPAMGWTLVPLSPYQGGSDSSFWPYNDKIREYDYMVGMNMLYGIIGSYRGGNGLYQTGVSQNVMETWGEFYNKYRDILGGDIVHIAPPLHEYQDSPTTTAWDGILHASADSEQKGLAAFFNQTNETVVQKVKIPLYFTGLTDRKTAPAPVEGSHYRLSEATRTSRALGRLGTSKDMTPGVPEIPQVDAVPTDQTAYVCFGDMNGKEYTIDSNGNIEVEITMEPLTYTWLTIYDPENLPEDVEKPVAIAAPENAAVKEQTGSQVTLTWDAVQMNGRDVKEYHIYRDGKYLDKTFTNVYKDTSIKAENAYTYEIKAVHNTVAGDSAVVRVSTAADETAPKAVAVKALDKNTVTVTFDEFVEEASAETIANYKIADEKAAKAELQKDGKTVVLTFEKAFTAFAETTLTVNGVKDLTGNVVKATDLAFEFGYLGEFKFEEEDGNIAENTKGDVDGSIQGEVNRADGIRGQGVVLDGTSSYVDAGDILKDRAEYSVAGWFKADAADGTQVLVGRERDSYDGNKWKLYVEDGTLKFTMNNGKGAYPGHEAEGEVVLSLASEAGAVQAGEWQQFALVQNGDYAAIYLNGELVAEDTKAGVSETLTGYTTWFGARRNNAGGEPELNLKGSMDELTVYNTVLTAEDVKDLYDAFQTDKDTYTVTVVNGTGSGEYAYNEKVTAKADAPATGMKFAGWKVNGEIVSTESEYVFYASNNMKLEAVYSEDGAVAEAKALITNVITTKNAKGTYDVKFVGQLVLPEGYTLKDAGLVWSSREATELVLGNGLKPTYIKQIGDTNQFSVTIKGMPAGKFLRGKIFATVEKDGKTETIYSAEKKAVTKK